MASKKDLHPEFVRRLDRFLADPEIRGRFRVGFTSRSYQRQQQLRRGWLKRLAGVPGFRRFNLAADPDRTIGRTDEGWVARGSWHMVQEDGFAYAVDLSRKRVITAKNAQEVIDRIAPGYGLRRTVPSEWWHIQGRVVTGWLFDPQTGADRPVVRRDDGKKGAEMRYFEDPNGSHVANGERHPITAFVTDDNETWVRQVIPKPSLRGTPYDRGPFEDVRFVIKDAVEAGTMILVGTEQVDTTADPTQ
jgi:hypothetical protein